MTCDLCLSRPAIKSYISRFRDYALPTEPTLVFMIRERNFTFKTTNTWNTSPDRSLIIWIKLIKEVNIFIDLAKYVLYCFNHSFIIIKRRQCTKTNEISPINLQKWDRLNLLLWPMKNSSVKLLNLIKSLIATSQVKWQGEKSV